MIKQLCSVYPLAAVRAGDDDAVGDDRAGVLSEALRVVGLDRPPHFLAGSRVERDQGSVRPREEQLVAVERQRAGGAGPHILRQPRAVDPDHVARRRVDRLHHVPRVGQEHHAVVHQRRRLVVARPHRDRPRELQIGDVVARHLIERAVAVAVARPPPAQPVAGRRVGEHLVGHRGQLVRHLLVDEARHAPPHPLARLLRAARLGHVGGIADRHPRIHRQHAVARHRAVRLQQVRHQIHVGLIAERAGLPRGHRVPHVGEQVIGRLPHPTVQEVHTRQRRRVHHALQGRSVTLFALHAVDRPAAGRLVRGEGPLRHGGLRRRHGGARSTGEASRHDQPDGCRPEQRSREIPSLERAQCQRARSAPTRSAAADASFVRHDPLLLGAFTRVRTARGRQCRLHEPTLGRHSAGGNLFVGRSNVARRLAGVFREPR